MVLTQEPAVVDIPTIAFLVTYLGTAFRGHVSVISASVISFSSNTLIMDIVHNKLKEIYSVFISDQQPLSLSV